MPGGEIGLYVLEIARLIATKILLECSYALVGRGQLRVAEIMEALEHALVRLSPKDRNLVTHIVQGNSYRFAAAREGLSVGAVKVRLNRVRPFLRVSVGEAIGMTLPAETTTKWRPPPRGRLAA